MLQDSRVSIRPPGKFTAETDWALWIKRFELYTREAEIQGDKKASELISLLGDEAFRIVCHLGLTESQDFEAVKTQLDRQFSPKGLELEWQFKLQHCQQTQRQSLTEFAAELTMLVDKAYPDWMPKQKLEIARNQFMRGIKSKTTQLTVMQEKPSSLEEALELAQQYESVEIAWKHLSPVSYKTVNTTKER